MSSAAASPLLGSSAPQISNSVTTPSDARPLPPVPNHSQLPFISTVASFTTVPSSPSFSLSQERPAFSRTRQDTLTPVHRDRVLSTFTPWAARAMKSSSFLAALQAPPVLAAVLAHLDWAEAFPLFCTCKALHDIVLTSSPLRDVVLARFVPGYAHSMRARDVGNYQDVQVSLRDLDLLRTSSIHPFVLFPFSPAVVCLIDSACTATMLPFILAAQFKFLLIYFIQ